MQAKQGLLVSRLRLDTGFGIPDLAGWRAYAAAVVVSVLAALAKVLLIAFGGTEASFTPYVPAIAVAAWLGGFRAGLVATVVATGLNGYLFLEPPGNLVPQEFPDQVRALLFAAGGLLIAALSGRLRGAVRALAEQRAEVGRSRDQLQAVLAAVTDAVTVQGTDGQLLYANDEAAALIGYGSADELLAAPISELEQRFEVLDETGSGVAAETLPGRRALRGERPPETLLRFRAAATGDERWCQVRAAPVFDPAGGVHFAVNLFRDVTVERRRLVADRFLADATAILAGMVDERHGMEELAALAVERVADWCVIDVLRPDGTAVDTEVAQADPAHGALARRLRHTRPVDPEASTGVGHVIRTGSPEWIARIAPAQLTDLLKHSGLKDELVALGLRSYVCAPLVVRGRPMGAISLFAAESPRFFDEHDLTVAVELGQRAGAAIEHARLYRAADARRSELTAILSAMREAVLVYDPDGQLALQNPAAVALIAPDGPQRLEQLATALDIEGGAPLAWSELSDGPPLEVRRRDGRWLELSTYRAKADRTNGAPPPPKPGTSSDATVPPTASGTVDGRQRPTRRRGSTILVVRDVTSSRTAQAAREAFMGLLSHELRTPITTIYGGTRLLERVTGEEQRREIVSDVRSEAERLYRLVEDLLVMTRVERGGVEIGDEPILLQRVLGSVAAVEETRWPGLEVQLRVPMGLPTVRGDPTYVEQVVRNLLTNAAKYGGVGEPVELVVADEGEEVSVRVLDRGPGIQRDEAEHLFDLFYRGESTARTASGAGIGLFVCRALVVAMGGRMWAAPREGGGAEFGFCLPVFGSDEDA